MSSMMTPGIPIGSFVKADCVTLSWENSVIFDANCTYQLNFKDVTTSGNWVYYGVYESNEAFVANLKPTTTYVFRVKLIKGDDEGPFSPISEPIRTKEPAALRYLQSASPVICNDSSIKYLLQLTEIADTKNDKAKSRKYELGSSEYGCNLKEKTILLVGATGTGKTTLVDAILNYVLGVKWTDPYRFSIVRDEYSAHSSTNKQVLTEWITCYTIHPTATSMLQYSLTVIDTPGFGGKIQEDNIVVDQMQAMCSEGLPKGIIGIDAICIVLKASDGRLTPAQNYIFDRIMSLFGRNVVSNICSFITFCDGTSPVVLNAMTDSKLPFGKHFQFNNSRLSVNEDTSENQRHFQMHYEMGLRSFGMFTEHLNTLLPVSLDETREVLKQRRRMENTQHNLLPKLQVGLTMLQSIKKVIEQYRQYEMNADANKDFEYTEERKVHAVKNAPPGQNLTNCTVCNQTCHESCSYKDDADKAQCVAMDALGYCKECDKKCHWSVHKNTPYIFYLETKTFKEVCQRKKDMFDSATKNLKSAKFDVEIKQQQYETQKEDVKRMLQDLKKCHDELKKIALRPVVLSMEEYINLLIQTEKNDQKSGFKERIQELEILKKEILIEDHFDALQVEEEIVRNECISIAKT